jgi:hypothetical protein
MSLLIGTHLPTCNGSSIRTELFIAKAKSTLTGLPGSINSENASRKKNQKMQLSSEKKVFEKTTATHSISHHQGRKLRG